MARIRGGASGALITQASLSSISFTVRDLTDAETITSAQSLTVASVVYDDLQQSDFRWNQDSAATPGLDGAYGYNFLATIPASHFAQLDVRAESPFTVMSHRYRVDVLFTPTSGQAWIVPFEFTALATWTS